MRSKVRYVEPESNPKFGEHTYPLHSAQNGVSRAFRDNFAYNRTSNGHTTRRMPIRVPSEFRVGIKMAKLIPGYRLYKLNSPLQTQISQKYCRFRLIRRSVFRFPCYYEANHG